MSEAFEEATRMIRLCRSLPRAQSVAIAAGSESPELMQLGYNSPVLKPREPNMAAAVTQVTRPDETESSDEATGETA